MIPAAYITAWSRLAPWPTDEQIEQDLVLSRLIVEIANHPDLGNELVFRGGTCLHKLALPEPLRYSEDLDYVRVSHGPIGPLLDGIRDIAAQLGMDTNTDVSTYSKVRLRLTPFAADVLTFQLEELVATKLRALFQRKKGRDLFDLWLALTILGLDPAEIVDCFGPYKPEGYTAERARQGLDEHLADEGFRWWLSHPVAVRLKGPRT